MSRLKIKRNTTNSDAPENTQLVRGELAFNEATESLYIGKGTSGSTADEIVNLGGKGLFLALTGAQTAAGNKTFSGNLTVGGNFTVNGTTTTINSTTTTVDDPVFTLGGDSAPGSDDNKDRGIEFRYHDGSNAKIGFFGWDDSAQGFNFLTAATNSSEVFSGTEAKLIAGSLDISGDADIDGTLEADAITVNGSTLASVIAGTTVTNATTAATGTQVTVSANNSANETVYPVFVDGATGAQGIESDTGLTYNPSTGVLTTTQVTGNLTGDVTGNTSGSSGSCTGNAATATALASARTIGGTSFDGTANIAVALSATATALATARNIGGVSFDGTANINLPGVNTAGNQDTTGTATNATHVLLTDNESTNENNVIPFGEGATATGNVGLESDGDFHYNPSTGTVTATVFDGTIDGGTWS